MGFGGSAEGGLSVEGIFLREVMDLCDKNPDNEVQVTIPLPISLLKDRLKFREGFLEMADAHGLQCFFSDSSQDEVAGRIEIVLDGPCPRIAALLRKVFRFNPPPAAGES